ncbi:P-loop containing nucleoside triphosphate hydrolase protein, partial [Thozetella sp. PMI_491]
SSQTQNYRQTNLFGQPVQEDRQSSSQQVSGRPYRGDTVGERPTHHELDHAELKTWVYPTNLGAIRDYQFSIVRSSLFSNTLVALPTGLGKTFIAATVILNFFRWTKKGKIVFVAPTKPLAAQQIDACLQVAGVPRSQATLLTGETSPVLREDEWATRRLFFMTPQTLINDLSKGYADPKSIVLLVVDEAHRATGDYAYVKVVEFMRRFSQSFRVLALTATPGSSVESVQEIIDNLGISHVEIRTEDSLDIRQYVHSRSIDTVVLDPSDEILLVRDLFSKALKPLTDKLGSMNSYYSRDPMSLTQYGVLKAQQDWMNGPGRHMNEGVKGMMRAIFSTLTSVAHGIKLLNFHGIMPFYENIREFRSTEEEKGGKGSKYRRQLLADENFQEMMSTIEKWIKLDGFMGHPKLTYLCDTLLNHFMDAGEGSGTRAIVFSEYRDSAEEIVRILNTHKPLVSATVFVGQADSKRSQGMKQKQQIETIEKFKTGVFNVLVATSIGEEGLDIGQVDLIVCYDASSSPIRMLQRMGRTGRKRAGNIVLLLLKGKEEEAYAKAQDNYAKMQAMICEGSRFKFRHDLSTRIVPREIKPEVEKRHVEIPIENTQNPSLPEPKKSSARQKRKPAKKVFHMPDGVETGFTTAASSFFGKSSKSTAPDKRIPAETDFLALLPSLEDVVLDMSQTAELDKLYRQYPSRDSRVEEIGPPRLDAFPAAQRRLRPTAIVGHGKYTKRCVALFRTLGKLQDPNDRYTYPYGELGDARWRAIPVPPVAGDPETDHEIKRQASGGRTTQARKPQSRCFLDDDLKDDGMEENEEEEDEVGLNVSSLASRRGGKRKPAAGRGGRGRGKGNFRSQGDRLEELGDDCTRTSDMEDTDGSDSGADLVDFIVDDDITSSMLRSELSTSPTSPLPTRRSSVFSLALTPKKQKSPKEAEASSIAGQSSVPIALNPTQDSDSDMPDLDALLGKASSHRAPKRKSKGQGRGLDQIGDLDGDDLDDEVVVSRHSVPKKRRHVLDDSDDDSD